MIDSQGDVKALFIKYAEYNAKMNQTIIQAMQNLGEENCKKSQGAFFDSILATVNHIMVGDLIWLNRFEPLMKMSIQAELTAFPKPSSLNAILCDNLTDYTNQRKKLDKLISDFIVNSEPDDFEKKLVYQNTKGMKFERNFGHLVSHFFNHQTHHRGQLTTLLYQQGQDVGVTDFLQVL